MSNSKEVIVEDLAIQDTLSMTTDARLELLAHLLVEKILEDQGNNEQLLTRIQELSA